MSYTLKQCLSKIGWRRQAIALFENARLVKNTGAAVTFIDNFIEMEAAGQTYPF